MPAIILPLNAPELAILGAFLLEICSLSHPEPGNAARGAPGPRIVQGTLEHGHHEIYRLFCCRGRAPMATLVLCDGKIPKI